MSLGQRLRQPRTIISIAIPLLLLVLIARFALNDRRRRGHPGHPPRRTRWLLLAAFGVFYLGFPLRGLRWQMLLQATGQLDHRVKDSTEILFLSWLVNCLVPAKLGDVYRAYLLKINSHGVAVADVRHRVHRAHPRPVRDRDPRPRSPASGASGAACRPRSSSWSPSASASSWSSGCCCSRCATSGAGSSIGLPLPHRGARALRAVRGGRVRRRHGSASCRSLVRPHRPDLGDRGPAAVPRRPGPRLPDVELGISGAFFVALIGSLLTAVPLSPAGLGVVEAGVVGVLTCSPTASRRPRRRDRRRRPRDQRVLDHRDRRRSCTSSRRSRRAGPDPAARRPSPGCRHVCRSTWRGRSGRRSGRTGRRSVPGRHSTRPHRTAHDCTTPQGRVDAHAPAVSTNG